MSEKQQAADAEPGFEEVLRAALLRQEEAIAGFIRAAAQHLERALAPDGDGGAAGGGGGAAAERPAGSVGGPPGAGAGTAGMRPDAARRAAPALADAARLAEALAELQRLTLELARALGAHRAAAGSPAPAPSGEARGVRVSPDKAAPAWFAPMPPGAKR